MSTTTATAAHLERTISRRTFAATVTGRHGHSDQHGPVSGPVVVTIEVTQARRADGVECWPNYSVKVDGWHRLGGCADHLPADGIPSCSWLTIGTELEAEQIGDLAAMTDVAAEASSYAAAQIIQCVDAVKRRRRVECRGDDLDLDGLLDDDTVAAGELIATTTVVGDVWVGIATGDTSGAATIVDDVVVFDPYGELLERFNGAELTVSRRITDRSELAYWADQYAAVLEDDAAALELEHRRLGEQLERAAAHIAAARKVAEVWCSHVDEGTVERVAHGYLGDRPAGTVEVLCAGCGEVRA